MKALFEDAAGDLIRLDCEVRVTEEQGTMMLTIAAVDGSHAVKVPLATVVDATLTVLRSRVEPPGVV